MTIIASFRPPSWLLTGFITQQVPWMLLVEQKQRIFLGNLSSILVFSWALYWGKNSEKKYKIQQQKKKKKLTKTKTLLSLVAIECLLFNPKWATFQLYQWVDNYLRFVLDQQASRNNIYMYTIVEQLNCHFHITIYHTQAEYAKHYITDSVSSGK